MSSRHLGFFEKHLEKLLIVLVGIFSLAVLWFYVIGSPYKAEVSTQQGTQELAPLDVEAMVKSKADDLKKALNDPKNPLPEMNVPPYARNFHQRYQAPLADKQVLATPLSEQGIHPKYTRSGGGDAGKYPAYILPTPAAAALPLVRADHAVLSDQIPAGRLEHYTKLVGSHQPRDFFYVSVKSQVDLKSWADQLRQAASPKVPEEWWKNHLLLTYVELERSELDLKTGQWSAPQSVSLLPNYPLSKLDRVPGDAPSDQVFALMARLQAAQLRLARAEFIPVSADRPWFSPDIDLSKVTEALRGKLLETLREIQDVDSRISAALGVAEELDLSVNRSVEPGMEGGYAPATPVTASGDNQQLAQLEQQMEQLIQRRDMLLKGQNPDDQPASPAAADAASAKKPAAASGPAAGTLMAHDVTVEPGKTYRYRVVVGLFNPLFRRQQVDLEQRKSSFEQLTVRSAPSQWSLPVTVAPMSRFYFVGADTRGARIEVWRLFNGRYQKYMMDAVAGDPIQTVGKFQYHDSVREIPIRIPMALVDVQAADARGGSTRGIFLNRLTGRLEERTIQADSENAQRKILLQEEAAAIAAAKAASGQPAAAEPSAAPRPLPPARTPRNRQNPDMPPDMDPLAPVPPGGGRRR